MVDVSRQQIVQRFEWLDNFCTIKIWTVRIIVDDMNISQSILRQTQDHTTKTTTWSEKQRSKVPRCRALNLQGVRTDTGLRMSRSKAVRTSRRDTIALLANLASTPFALIRAVQISAFAAVKTSSQAIVATILGLSQAAVVGFSQAHVNTSVQIAPIFARSFESASLSSSPSSDVSLIPCTTASNTTTSLLFCSFFDLKVAAKSRILDWSSGCGGLSRRLKGNSWVMGIVIIKSR